MINENTSALMQEWNVLQQQHEAYEHKSLSLKMFSTLVLALLMFHNRFDFVLPVLLLCLWVQEGIWKTFQGRLGERLIIVEQALANNTDEPAMQLNNQWQQIRPGFIGLIVEYIKNTCRPTVAFPHFIYLIISAGLTLL